MEKIILKSKKIFGEKFDFNNCNFQNYDKKITIKCKVHNNTFDILPSNHTRQIYGGCNLCKKDDISKIKLNENEVIKDVNIEKYKNLYLITNKGRCFSKKTNKELSSRLRTGYKTVGLWYNKNDSEIEKENLSVHILVYITFKNDYDSKKIIDHIDGNKLNNDIMNLRCISQSDNVKNAYVNNDKMFQQKIIQAFDKNNNLIKEFNSTKEASIFINHTNTTSITNCLRGYYKSAGCYIWKFKDDNINEEKKNKYIDIKNDEEYKCIGKINNEDYSNYYINKDGIIINKKYNNNRKISIFTNANGYSVVYLFYMENKKKQFQLHRLLGKIFLKDGEKYFNDKKYVINHIDENKTNNKINNLEWTTYKQNTNHSCARKVVKIDLKTNEIIKTYNSVTEASKDNLTGISTISYACNGKRKTLFGYKWKYLDS